MATTVIVAEEFPPHVRGYIEVLFRLPRIEAVDGLWVVELVGVDGVLQRVFRKQRVDGGALEEEAITWPIPAESP